MPNNVTYKFELSESTVDMLSNFATALHNKNPPVKTLVSIGGGGSDSKLFARIAASSSGRQIFVKSSIELARKVGLDGLDLDWEFPDNPTEMGNLGLLFEEWRAEINKEAKLTKRAPLLLTAAVYFSVDFFLWGEFRTYPVASIRKNMDWVSPMCFDYHGSWDISQTGAHAALFDPNSKVSTSYGLRSWIRAGVPQDKLVMGIPLYGRSWILKDPKSHGIGAPAVAVGPGNGMSYSNIIDFNMKNNATVVYDARTVSMYSYAGTSWIGYDGPMSVTVKVGYAQALGLRGYFFWAVNNDKEWSVSRQGKHKTMTTLYILLMCMHCPTI